MVGAEIWTGGTWHCTHSSSLSLPVFPVSGHNLSQPHSVSEVGPTLPHPVLPRREEPSCLLCQLLWEWPPAAQPPAWALFSLSSQVQPSPSLGSTGSSLPPPSQDHCWHCAVQLSRSVLTEAKHTARVASPPPGDQKSVCQQCPQAQPPRPRRTGLSLSSEAGKLCAQTTPWPCLSIKVLVAYRMDTWAPRGG